jgi:hypothetical protein
VAAGGVQCRDHKRGLSLSAEALEIMQGVLGGRVAEVLNRTGVTVHATREVVEIARATTEHHLERRIHSTSLFEAPRAG